MKTFSVRHESNGTTYQHFFHVFAGEHPMGMVELGMVWVEEWESRYQDVEDLSLKAALDAYIGATFVNRYTDKGAMMIAFMILYDLYGRDKAIKYCRLMKDYFTKFVERETAPEHKRVEITEAEVFSEIIERHGRMLAR